MDGVARRLGLNGVDGRGGMARVASASSLRSGATADPPGMSLGPPAGARVGDAEIVDTKKKSD